MPELNMKISEMVRLAGLGRSTIIRYRDTPERLTDETFRIIHKLAAERGKYLETNPPPKESNHDRHKRRVELFKSKGLIDMTGGWGFKHRGYTIGPFYSGYRCEAQKKLWELQKVVTEKYFAVMVKEDEQPSGALIDFRMPPDFGI